MSSAYSEDLFEETKMSFGEHLEELRKVLVRALAGTAIAVIIAMLWADRIVLFLQSPLEEAITEYNLERAKKKIRSENGGFVPPEIVPLLDDQQLIPHQYTLEADTLDRLLFNRYPEISRTTSRKPHAFLPTQLTLENVTPLAKELIAKETSGPSIDYLKGLLTEEQKKSLTKLAELKEATSADQETLLAILDQLASAPDLYKQTQFTEAFAGVKSNSYIPSWLQKLMGTTEEIKQPLEEIRAKIEKEKDATQLRRLNRLLITDSLSKFLAPVQAEVHTIELWERAEINAQALNAQEPFMIWMKAALISGLILASPWILYQVWQFVAAGLYPHERRYVHMYLPLSLTLFLAGVCLAFFGVFKPVLIFLLQFNESMGIDPQPRIGEWLTFVMLLPLGFGLAFQLPMVMLFLNRIGLMSIEAYLEKWRIAVLVIFVVSMILTPAEPISMIMMAIPLTFLYFFGVMLCKWMPRGKNPFAEAYEP